VLEYGNRIEPNDDVSRQIAYLFGLDEKQAEDLFIKMEQW
jgi:hypothetical protein